jgi:FkbM family methyltransferase
MKLAIYTIMIGNNPMFEYTRHSMELYAKRINADLIIRTEQLSNLFEQEVGLNVTTACFEKLFIEDLLQTYDRVLYLDADILIHPNSPNIFDIYSDVNKVYMFHEAAYEDRAFCVQSICQQLNYNPKRWKKLEGRYIYYNGGVILCSKESNFLKYKSIEEFRNLYGKIPHHDQTYFSYLIQKHQVQNQPIDYRFDRMDYMGNFEQRFEAYFIHYAGAGYSQPPEKREDVIKKDFQKLFNNHKNQQDKIIINANFNELKQTHYGYMLYNKNDIYVGGCLKHYGEFSEGEIDLFRQIVRPNQIVLDIGANIGAHTLFFSEIVGNQGAVLAFEPQRIIFQTLCANIALNGLTNVHCYQLALGPQQGSVSIPPINYNEMGNFGGISMANANQGENVSMTTLDSFRLNKCHFIKIDVEGMEQYVLAGAVETIKKHRPLMYVENDRKEKSADLIRFIASLGYRMFWHTPPLVNLANNFYNNSSMIFDRNIVSINMFCIPQELQINVQGFREIMAPEDNWKPMTT